MHKTMVFDHAYISESAKELFKNADTQVLPGRDWDLADGVKRGKQAAVSLKSFPSDSKGQPSKDCRYGSWHTTETVFPTASRLSPKCLLSIAWSIYI